MDLQKDLAAARLSTNFNRFNALDVVGWPTATFLALWKWLLPLPGALQEDVLGQF